MCLRKEEKKNIYREERKLEMAVCRILNPGKEKDEKKKVLHSIAGEKKMQEKIHGSTKRENEKREKNCLVTLI